MSRRQIVAGMVLSPGVIHLWSIDLDAEGRPEMLSRDEQARAERFHFDIHRKRYITGRSALRSLLARYIAGPISFTYTPAGKPTLPGAGISFNLAHSGQFAIAGVTRETALGVDIEVPRAFPDLDQLAEFSFSAGEAARWRNLAENQKLAGFYRCWTRKEAYLKATGEGIATRLKTFEVAFEDGEPPRILKGAEGAWTLLDISEEPVHFAAIAYAGLSPKLERFSFKFSE